MRRRDRSGIWAYVDGVPAATPGSPFTFNRHVIAAIAAKHTLDGRTASEEWTH